MHPQTSFVKNPLSLSDLPLLSDKWLFVGIDLAPNETLETGVAVLDRDRQMMRMDKLYTDEDIFTFLNSLGPRQNLLIALDVPKSLSIPGRWRQEEIKMHPLRLARKDGGESTDRYAQRARSLFDDMRENGWLCLLYFSYFAKMNYEITIPFRTRTPQGCRALQSTIKTRLNIPNVPTNLAPSSVLDAMIGAYSAWCVYRGTEGEHFQLFSDAEGRYYLDPLSRFEPTTRRRRHR